MIGLPLAAAFLMQCAPAAEVPGDSAAVAPVETAVEADAPPDGGEVVVTARKHSKGDPLEAVNVKSFEATQKVDDAVVGPVAMAYERNVPSPIRDGFSNFRYNLQEPIVFANFLLQAKAGKAAETLGRFVINSTIGIAGLFDIAKRKAFKLPRRRNSFATTLGFYGVGPGPYFFLPLIGPTTARDLFGRIVDHVALPPSLFLPLHGPAYTVPTRTVAMLGRRAEFDDQLQAIRQSPDPYVARREAYLNKRQAEIDHLRGRDRIDTEVAAVAR